MVARSDGGLKAGFIGRWVGAALLVIQEFLKN
jgi:hypothetical protein